MSASARFQKFAGNFIIVVDRQVHAYVPDGDEHEDLAEIVVEDTHPDEMLEDGYEVVAVLGAFEEGDFVQPEGFIAINEEEDRAYVCDEGSIEFFDTPASKLTIELNEDK